MDVWMAKWIHVDAGERAGSWPDGCRWRVGSRWTDCQPWSGEIKKQTEWERTGKWVWTWQTQKQVVRMANMLHEVEFPHFNIILWGGILIKKNKKKKGNTWRSFAMQQYAFSASLSYKWFISHQLNYFIL